MHDGKFNLITTEQKLLFDIKQLLIEQNELLKQVINPGIDTVFKTEIKTKAKRGK